MTPHGIDGAPVASLDDPRIEAYRNLKDHELAERGDLFIAEGELVVRRLLASDCPVESVLLAEDKLAEIAPLARQGVPIYAAPAELVSRIVGFQFHSGVIACGRRPVLPTLDDVATGWPESITLLILPNTTSTQNMGALLRIAAAFGVDGVVLGPRCCDPFYRQSVRVSMGAIFSLTLIRSQRFDDDMLRLRTQWGVQLAAAALDDEAEPLSRAGRPARLGLLLGNEAQGLSPEHAALCGRRITIPMKLGTDSLNVAVAAGVFLYHFTSERT